MVLQADQESARRTPKMSPSLIKRSFRLAGTRTSLALEQPFWDVLERIAEERKTSLSKLIAEIGRSKGDEGSLASAVRVWVLAHVK